MSKFGYINSKFNAVGVPYAPVIPPAPSRPPFWTLPISTPAAPTTPPSPSPSPSPTPEPTPSPVLGKKGLLAGMEQTIAYGIGAVAGATAGYLIAKKYNKNIYGGLLIGGGALAGSVYLYFNGKDLWSRISRKNRVGEAAEEPKSNAAGRLEMRECKGDCVSKYKPISDYWKAQYYKMPIKYPPVPLENPKITFSELQSRMSAIGKAYDCCLIKCYKPRYDCSENIDMGKT